ncbi:hypothetical protein D3C78_937980 [compost metagenome]
MGVVHRLDALGDDRTLVEVVVDEVGGGADQLDPLLVGLVVGLGTLEAGQQRVVDVDRAAVETTAQLGGEHLHVAGKDHQFGAAAFDHLEHPRFLGGLVQRVEGEVVVGDAVPAGQRLEVRMVGHHRGDVHRQLADALAVEQVVEAVVGLGDHDHHLGPVTRWGQLGLHGEGRDPPRQLGAEVRLGEAGGRAELGADEEATGLAVVEAVVLGDVAALFAQEAGDHVHRAEQARAVGGENPGIGCAAHMRTRVFCLPSPAGAGPGVWAAPDAARPPSPNPLPQAGGGACCRQAFTASPYSALASCSQSQM